MTLEESNIQTIRCKCLHLRVINLAILDVQDTWGSEKRSDVHIWNDAISYFFSPDSLFVEWCQSLNIDHNYIRESIIDESIRNWKVQESHQSSGRQYSYNSFEHKAGNE